MVKPVEVIEQARRRIALLSAVREAVRWAIPAAAALGGVLLIDALGALIWHRWGYVLAPGPTMYLRLGALATGIAALAAGGWAAFRGWRNSDFLAAAGRIDDLLNAHAQVITLATFSDPIRPRPESRSALFPLLWHYVLTLLARFDPKSAFKFELDQPMARSGVAAMLLLVVFALATLAFVRPPTSEQALALSLERSAQELAAQATTPTDRALAEQALKTAEALRKTSTPPREKLQQVTSLLHELKQRSQAAAQAGAGQGASKNAAGTGAGTGTGTGKGSSPTAAGAGSAKGKQKPGEATIIKLETDLKKAQAQLESSSGPKTGPKPEPSAGPNQNQTLTRGKSPQQKGPEPQPQPNGAAQKTPSQTGNNQKQQAGQKPSPKKGGSAGDTRRGEVPKPERFVRFYRPGEKGAPLEIRNARYMVFRIPPAPAAAGGGKTVLDSGRPKASVPYTNVPLRVGTLPAAPEERQMVPYRYRDLIY